jgi:SAM-dependent methyltransferase
MNGYDRIADIYGADMGASMRLPDIDLYLGIARQCQGPVLELGCGSGRILRVLLADGIDAWGIDLSLPMLLQARRNGSADRSGLVAGRIVQMDMRRLAFTGGFFALALLPYSLVTYLLEDTDWQALAMGMREALRPGGDVVVDAFLPQPNLAGRGWLRDYARRHDGGWLVRHKRIQALDGGIHQVDRRYRLAGAWQGRTLQTSERIRPYTAQQLAGMAERHLGRVRAVYWDYGVRADAISASYCSLHCRLD